ncbi:hypothetical protein OSTOST_02243 [Ostertagia ostertagi]
MKHDHAVRTRLPCSCPLDPIRPHLPPPPAKARQNIKSQYVKYNFVSNGSETLKMDLFNDKKREQRKFRESMFAIRHPEVAEEGLSSYRDSRFKKKEFEEALRRSTTVYVGNLSFYTSEDQIPFRTCGTDTAAATGGRE